MLRSARYASAIAAIDSRKLPAAYTVIVAVLAGESVADAAAHAVWLVNDVNVSIAQMTRKTIAPIFIVALHHITKERAFWLFIRLTN